MISNLLDFDTFEAFKKSNRNRGNLELTASDAFEIDALFLERRMRGRGKKSEAKKVRRQKTKKSKHILKMVKVEQIKEGLTTSGSVKIRCAG